MYWTVQCSESVQSDKAFPYTWWSAETVYIVHCNVKGSSVECRRYNCSSIVEKHLSVIGLPSLCPIDHKLSLRRHIDEDYLYTTKTMMIRPIHFDFCSEKKKHSKPSSANMIGSPCLDSGLQSLVSLLENMIGSPLYKWAIDRPFS